MVASIAVELYRLSEGLKNETTASRFLSNVPESTRRYVGRATDKTLTFKRDARAASDKAANDIGNEAEADRSHAGPLGAFSDTSSRAEIVEGIDGRQNLATKDYSTNQFKVGIADFRQTFRLEYQGFNRGNSKL